MKLMPHWWIEKQFIPVSLPGQFFPNSPPRALIFAILCLPRLLKSEPLSDWRTLDQNTSKYQLQQQQKYYLDFISCVLWFTVWQQFILKILEASILSGVCKICNNSVCCRFSKLLQLGSIIWIALHDEILEYLRKYLQINFVCYWRKISTTYYDFEYWMYRMKKKHVPMRSEDPQWEIPICSVLNIFNNFVWQ